MLKELKCGFIGFGHMGQAIFDGLIKSHLLAKHQIRFTRKDPKKKNETERKEKITGMRLDHLLDWADLLIFAVRPQDFKALVIEMKPVDLTEKLLISILAGIPFSLFYQAFGREIQLARYMPNLASELGEGMNILSWDESLRFDHQEMVKMVLSPLGKNLFLKEEMIDVAVGLSGSAPAFVAALINAHLKLGVSYGIDQKDALEMALQTFLGTVKLIEKKRDPVQLIKQISVEGGTTVEGLKEIEKQDLLKRYQRVLTASIERSKELSLEIIKEDPLS